MGGPSKGGSSKSGGNGKQTGSVCNNCGKKSFAYIHLEGGSFFGQVVPAYGFDGEIQKVGTTVTIKENGLKGTAAYYYNYDSKPYASTDIFADVSGSCTILTTNATGTPFEIDRCELHCTISLMYEGTYCDSTKKGSCCPVVGYATLTGDFNLDVELNAEGTITDTFEQLTNFDGIAAVTGGAFDLAGFTNGALGFVEFLGDVKNKPVYKFNLGVPFDDDAACKLSSDALAQI